MQGDGAGKARREMRNAQKVHRERRSENCIEHVRIEMRSEMRKEIAQGKCAETCVAKCTGTFQKESAQRYA